MDFTLNHALLFSLLISFWVGFAVMYLRTHPDALKKLEADLPTGFKVYLDKAMADIPQSWADKFSSLSSELKTHVSAEADVLRQDMQKMRTYMASLENSFSLTMVPQQATSEQASHLDAPAAPPADNRVLQVGGYTVTAQEAADALKTAGYEVSK